MERADLEEIAEIVMEKDIFVLSDEIYSELSYKGDHVTIASHSGYERAYHSDQRIFQGLCHDRMASGLCLRTERDY